MSDEIPPAEPGVDPELWEGYVEACVADDNFFTWVMDSISAVKTPEENDPFDEIRFYAQQSAMAAIGALQFAYEAKRAAITGALYARSGLDKLVEPEAQSEQTGKADE